MKDELSGLKLLRRYPEAVVFPLTMPLIFVAFLMVASMAAAISQPFQLNEIPARALLPLVMAFALFLPASLLSGVIHWLARIAGAPMLSRAILTGVGAFAAATAQLSWLEHRQWHDVMWFSSDFQIEMAFTNLLIWAIAGIFSLGAAPASLLSAKLLAQGQSRTKLGLKNPTVRI